MKKVTVFYEAVKLPSPDRLVFYHKHKVTENRYYNGPVLLGVENVLGSEIIQIPCKWHLTKIRRG